MIAFYILKKKNITAKTLIVILLVYLILACSEKNFSAFESSQRFMMDTVISLKISKQKKTENIFAEFFSEFERIDRKYSRTDTGSIIYKINNRSDSSVYIDSETAEIIGKCLDYYKLTNGCFDISMFTIGQFWNFNLEEDTTVPEKIKKSLDFFKYSGSDKISLNGNTLSFGNPHLLIDLGAVAKGYAIDKSVQILKKHNISSALINAGGEIYALNFKKENIKWNIAIQDPENSNAYMKVVRLKDECVSTSGNYNRFVKYSGKRYCHIFNPKTGKNVDYFSSVSIIGKDGFTADVFSTAIMAAEQNYAEVWHRIRKYDENIICYAKKGNSDLIELDNRK